MIRAIACLLLIIGSTLTALPVPLLPPNIWSTPQLQSATSGTLDPDGSKLAFNTTLTHFDLYTRANTTLATGDPPPPGTATWSSRFRNATGSQIPDTSFNYKLPGGSTTTQSVNYTLNIPLVPGTNTFIIFRWNGTLGPEATAQYKVYNGTGPSAKLVGNTTKSGTAFTGGPPANTTKAHPFSCSTQEECILVSKYAGFRLTLNFTFATSLTGGNVDVDVTNVMVVSAGTTPTDAESHIMSLNQTNQDEVQHTAQTLLIYSANVSYAKPSNMSQQLAHKWQQIAVTFLFPSSYNLGTIKLNATNEVFQGHTAIAQGKCIMSICTNSSFVSLNMVNTTSIHTTADITSTSTNPLDPSSIQPLLAGVPTDAWMPGDTVPVRTSSHPGVNVSATQTIVFSDQDNLTRVSQSFSNKGGTYLYNVTLPNTARVGNWNVTATFLSGYDFGRRTHTITLEQLQIGSLTVSGTAGQGGSLAVQGNINYDSTSGPAAGVNAAVFVIDQGSLPGTPISTTTSETAGLYVSNITLVNGFFKRDQSLTMFFTIANPTPSTDFNATLKVEHQWYDPGGTHGAFVQFPLELGDQPFRSASSSYRMDVALSLSGVQITVRSIYNQEITETLSAGTAGVPATRWHFGSFRISAISTPTSGTTTTHSLTSPTYAYAPDFTLSPSRLLAFNSTITTSANGDFTARVGSDKILGASTLTVFALARDPNGIGLGPTQITTVKDSTSLTFSANAPSEVIVGQHATADLTIRNNSTRFPVTLTVSLTVASHDTSEVTSSNTFTIQPGSTQTMTFGFNAPAGAGSAILTFSSQQYGATLATKTLQVSLLQSSLQLLIPAIIGLVAALIIIGIYIMRRKPETEVEEKTRPKPGPGKPSKPQSSRNP